MNQKYKDAKTQQLIVGKQTGAYRRLGAKTHPPCCFSIIWLRHLMVATQKL